MDSFGRGSRLCTQCKGAAGFSLCSSCYSGHVTDWLREEDASLAQKGGEMLSVNGLKEGKELGICNQCGGWLNFCTGAACRTPNRIFARYCRRCRAPLEPWESWP